jgi:hypothetical protein
MRDKHHVSDILLYLIIYMCIFENMYNFWYGHMCNVYVIVFVSFGISAVVMYN